MLMPQGVFFSLMLAVLAGSAPAQEQTRADEAFPCKNIENLPSVRALFDSTTFHYNKFNFSKSAEFLHKALAEEKAGMYKLDKLCRAAIYQQLARCHDDSATLDLAENYVIQSLKEDPEIWREHAHPLLSERLQRIYRKCWNQMQTDFMKKRRSWRVAVGPIARVDFSNRFDIATGIGTSVVRIEELNDAKLFEDLLLYVRVQRMRKNIERLMPGYYGEFSLSLKKAKKPAQILSFGPILGYACQSGWEIGGTFEIARLVIGGGKTRISQTIATDNNKLAFSYANFEVYLRKWF
ncbi:MAG: hypothetical protein ONB41_25300 [candidate division KSB1 bacterium]|nr:hypothetical protein [candidate division KSB1 bacterium]